jgi:translocation and assembly module TamB
MGSDIEPVTVMGGAIWGDNPRNDFVDSHGVATPDAFWKVLIREDRAIAWLIPNTAEATRKRLDSYNNHITGEVNVQRGRFRAYGQDLTIRNGRVIFAGLANNPDLQLEAIRQSRDRNTIGGLRVTGTLQESVGELFAEPSMTDSDVAYFLLTGRRPPELGQKDTTSGGALLNLVLARTNESAAKLASRLGIEGFQISTADGEQGFETHLRGYLSDDLFVSYGTGFEEKTASLTLQYYITPHVVVEAVGGFTSALDIVYSFRAD